jgi:hypothetical protein
MLDPQEGIRHDVVSVVWADQNPREAQRWRAQGVPSFLDRRPRIESS